MRELLYTILELEEWNREINCFFCYEHDNKAVCQIRTRSKMTDKIVANDCACENCKEKFENDELPKCERCGRLQNKSRVFIGNCRCIEYNEDTEEKELSVSPDDWRPNAFYERQINALREEKTAAKEELEIEREEVVKFQEKSEEWGKRQKQELLDRIKELEEEIAKLVQENKQLKEQQTVQSSSQIEINEVKKWPLKLKK